MKKKIQEPIQEDAILSQSGANISVSFHHDTSDVRSFSSLQKHVHEVGTIPVLKCPVPPGEGGGLPLACLRRAAALVFAMLLPTGIPSLLSQFPAIVLLAASRHRPLPGSGERWDVRAPRFPLISFSLNQRGRGACER